MQMWPSLLCSSAPLRGARTQIEPHGRPPSRPRRRFRAVYTPCCPISTPRKQSFRPELPPPFGRIRPNVGRFRSKFGRRPSFSKFRLQLGRGRPRVVPIQPFPSPFGSVPRFGRQSLVKLGPTSTDFDRCFGPMTAKIAPASTKFGRRRPESARLRRNSARILRMCTASVPERATQQLQNLELLNRGTDVLEMGRRTCPAWLLLAYMGRTQEDVGQVQPWCGRSPAPTQAPSMADTNSSNFGRARPQVDGVQPYLGRIQPPSLVGPCSIEPELICGWALDPSVMGPSSRSPIAAMVGITD